MSWYFRRSRKLGPFRVTVSSSGVSGSLGIGGVRLTSSPSGTYVSASPGARFYFRERLDSRPERPHGRTRYNTASTPMQEISSNDAAGMIDHAAILERINQNARRAAWLPWFGMLVAVLLTTQRQEIGLAIGACFTALCFWMRYYLRGAFPVELNYQLNDTEKHTHQTLLTALKSLSESKRLWQINAFGNTNDWKRNAGANQLINRSSSAVGRGTPRTFRSNVEVANLKLAGETLYFLPDMIFVQQKKSVGSVAYSSLTVADTLTQFRETDGVPSDSQQVGATWRYVNKNGSPDRRFNNNRQIPIALYGEVAMRSDSGLRVALMASSVDAARAFATGMRALQQLAPANMLYLQAPAKV